MHFVSIGGVDIKDSVKIKGIADLLNLRRRFDYRLKRWELFSTTKISNYKTKLLNDWANRMNYKIHSWEGDDNYSPNVYSKK